MPTVLEELQIVISTELSQFKSGMNEVRSVIEGIKPAVGALGLALTSLIATGFQNVMQSADAMRDVSRVLQGMGYDVDAVGERVRAMAESLSDATRYDDADIIGAFETLLGVTQDVDTAMLLWGPTLDLAAARGIDVEQAAQAIARYAKEGGGSLIKWYPFLKDAATEAERMQAITAQLGPIIGGAASRSATLRNAWEDLRKTAGDFTKVFVPDSLQGQGLIAFLNKASDAIKVLGTAISEHMTPIQKELLALASAVAVLIGGPASLAALAGSLGLGGLAGSLGGLSAVLGPLGIAIGVLGAAWITNFGGIREQTAAFWTRVQPILQGLWSHLQTLAANIKQALDPIMPYLERAFGFLLNVVLRFAEDALRFFSWLADGAGVLVTKLAEAWQWIAGETTGVWSALRDAVRDIWNSISETAGVVFAVLSDKIKIIWNGVKAFWDEWGVTIVASLGIVWDTIKLTVTTAINAVKDVIGLVLAIIRGDWADAWERVKDLTKTAVDFVKGLFGELLDMAKTWGTRLLGNFIDGIKERIANLKAAASEAVQAVKDFLGFSSPAKEGPGADADEWMPNLIGMWADQLVAGKAQIAAAVSQIAGGLQIAPQLNALAAAGGGGGVNYTFQITGNTFRNREDIDYLRRQIEDVLEEKNRRIASAVGKWV